MQTISKDSGNIVMSSAGGTYYEQGRSGRIDDISHPALFSMGDPEIEMVHQPADADVGQDKDPGGDQ
jgi:hypothetical protein